MGRSRTLRLALSLALVALVLFTAEWVLVGKSSPAFSGAQLALAAVAAVAGVMLVRSGTPDIADEVIDLRDTAVQQPKSRSIRASIRPVRRAVRV
jgi:hypothetical protein